MVYSKYKTKDSTTVVLLRKTIYYAALR